jgi:hypothetical protein
MVISTALWSAAIAFPVAGWIVGGLYLAADITSQVLTEKSLTENMFD